jgi:hypothetical protein
MALLAPEDILKALGELDPWENPFLFVNKVLRDAFKQKANPAMTAVLGVCVLAWLVSIYCSVQNLRSKLRGGDWTLVRKQSTVWGNFHM